MNPARNTLIKDFTKGKISKKLLLFSIPLVLANVLQTLYNLVDMAVVGNYVGSVGLSAVSNAGDIIFLFTSICMGFSSAGQVLVAQYVGLKDPDGIRKTIGTIFSFMFIASVVMMTAGLLAVGWTLKVINVPAAAYEEARKYCVVAYWGLFFIFGYNMVSAILRGMGDSKRPLIIIAFSATLNLGLDLVFVAGLGLGVMGAAIATVISQGVGFIGALGYLYRKREAFGFDFKPASFAMDRVVVEFLFRQGLPIALQLSTLSISKVFINTWINSYGVIISALTGVGMKIGMVASVVCGALQMSGASFMGQNFSAGKHDRMAKAIYMIFIWGLIFSVFLSAVVLIFPKQVYGLFTTDAAVLALSDSYIPILVINFVAFGLRAPMLALIYGLGNGRLSLIIGILDSVVARVGGSALLCFAIGMGYEGLWYGNALAGLSPFIIGGVYFWSGMWKKRKLTI